MWIVDDDGYMFNTDHFVSITYGNTVEEIKLWTNPNDGYIFTLSNDLTDEERLTRYYDIMEKLTGERIDG